MCITIVWLAYDSERIYNMYTDEYTDDIMYNTILMSKI